MGSPCLGPVPLLALPLTGDLSAHPSVTLHGPHRFVMIDGRKGYHPCSLKTELHVATDVHLGNVGSMALSVSPLETLGTAVGMWGFESTDPNAREYGLVADAFPTNDTAASIFGWYWRSVWHPQMIAKFKAGAAAGGHADFGVTPYVPVEHLPLREGHWYEFVLTWNKAESRLRIYVNGVLCGTTSYPFRAETPRPGLYLGNTAMAFADFRLYDVEFSEKDVSTKVAATIDPVVQDELLSLHAIRPRPAVDLSQDAPCVKDTDLSWKLAYDNSLCEEGSFAGWIRQGCMEPGFELREFLHTPEGLLLETPEGIHVESRVYFWSPQVFEGDLAVQFDFRAERD
ncbi:MAG TPA: LamG-like jellyroll fold domain-containing protein, partial [Candidatus Methylacidiphilales bacterium]|nr:LamG-like jellyroll fold domain-containing protein [Candidatus Methylacidiphilales bacterium]